MDIQKKVQEEQLQTQVKDHFVNNLKT